MRKMYGELPVRRPWFPLLFYRLAIIINFISAGGMRAGGPDCHRMILVIDDVSGYEKKENSSCAGT